MTYVLIVVFTLTITNPHFNGDITIPTSSTVETYIWDLDVCHTVLADITKQATQNGAHVISAGCYLAGPPSPPTHPQER